LEWHVQPAADRKHHITIAPHCVAAGCNVTEVVAIIDDTASAPVGENRCADKLRETNDFGCGFDRSAADRY
jgi:hypothetical protein